MNELLEMFDKPTAWYHFVPSKSDIEFIKNLLKGFDMEEIET